LEFPLLGRIVKPVLQALPLLIFADVEEELQRCNLIFLEQAFKVVDLIEPLGPNRLGHQPMNSRYEHVLIMGTVEDADLTFAGTACGPAIENREYSISVTLEGSHSAALRIWPDMMRCIVPSLPPASIACRTMRSAHASQPRGGSEVRRAATAFRRGSARFLEFELLRQHPARECHRLRHHEFVGESHS
jgi:hypothetical protein